MGKINKLYYYLVISSNKVFNQDGDISKGTFNEINKLKID